MSSTLLQKHSMARLARYAVNMDFCDACKVDGIIDIDYSVGFKRLIMGYAERV